MSPQVDKGFCFHVLMLIHVWQNNLVERFLCRWLYLSISAHVQLLRPLTGLTKRWSLKQVGLYSGSHNTEFSCLGPKSVGLNSGPVLL